MKRNIVKILGAIVLSLFLVIAFGGCKGIGGFSGGPTIIGYWASSYGDGFEIKSESGDFMYYQYDDLAKTVSFAGEIVGEMDYYAESSYITILITETGTWAKDVDEYYRVHYKSLAGDDTVQQSSAYNTGSDADVNDGVPTQEGAETEFTIGNGYFTYYGTYEKQ